MRSRLLILLAALPLAAISLASEDAPACYTIDIHETPEIAEDDLEACELETWIHRATTPAGNLATTGADAHPTWDTNPPTASVTTGAGGGYLGSLAGDQVESGSDITGARFVGQFDGVVDTMHVSLYGFYTGYGSINHGPANRQPHAVYVSLAIDGTQVVNGSSLEITTLTQPAETANAAERFDFALSGIAELMHAYRLDPTGTHTIELTVTPRYLNTDVAVLYVYDTTEVPAGIVFNPATIPPDVPVKDLY